MRYAALAAAGAASANAALQGFNYGAGLTTGAAKTVDDFTADFKAAQNLAGTSGWNAARLYTSIQVGTTNSPISAFQAAMNTNTKLLLGIWASAGQDAVTNELAAIDTAVQQYGSKFTDLVVGLSVGSEDLYRITPTGIENKAGIGAGPDVLTSYISQVKAKNWGFKIGHVDTWTAWTNSSNNAVIEAVDWVGFDGYPYFESTLSNSIDNALQLFDQSFEATIGAAGGKEVWMTETGWPVSGPVSGSAVASTDNAEKYWQAVACRLLNSNTNTFWYTLRDAEPDTPSPSFGILPADASQGPLYNLTCASNASSFTSSSSSSAVASGTATAKASGTASGSSSSATSTSGSSGSASSASGTSGNTTAGTQTGNSASGTTSANPAKYSTGAASSSSLSAVAAIAAFVGIVARM